MTKTKTTDKPFMQDEIDACGRASSELKKQLDDLRSEFDAYENTYAGPCHSYLAIGLKDLSKENQEDLTRLLKEAPAVKDKLMARHSELKQRCDDHIARQTRLIAALEKYNESLRNQNDEILNTEVNKIAGLLSYGMACGNLGGPEWKFAKSVIEDFRGAKDRVRRKEHYSTLQAVLASCEYPPFNPNAAPTALSEFESIQDPEDSSRHYRAHREEIHKAYGAQIDSQNIK